MDYLGLSITKILKLRIRQKLYSIKYYFKYVLKNRAFVVKIKSLKNTKKGKKVFVFANGPSLKLISPEKIKKYQKDGYDVFAVNSYINTEFGRIAEPSHYVLSDPVYFGIDLDLHSEKRKQEFKEDLEAIKKNQVTLFAPFQYSRGFNYSNFFAFNDAEDLFSKKSLNPLLPRPYVSMTPYKALAIACYLGYDEIYICGVDNNYFKSLQVSEDNKIYYQDEHFYGASEGNKHQVKDYQEGKNVGELLYTHHFLFTNLSKVFSSYKIINLHKESLVTAFPKGHNLDVYL